jgi:hypothetical protein
MSQSVGRRRAWRWRAPTDTANEAGTVTGALESGIRAARELS